MARPTIKDIKTLGDFATLFRWEVGITPPAAIASTATSAGLNFRCESIDSPPKATNQKIEENIRGHKIFQPGITQYNNQIQLTMVETVDNFVHEFFSKWREALWLVSDGKRSGTGSDWEAYKCDISLTRLKSDDTPAWYYVLYGAFLEDYEPGGSLDGSSSDFLKPSLTFSYDFFKEGSTQPTYA